MRLTVLGCGTSTGVPLIHCECEVCLSHDPKNNRLRASVWLQIDGKSILVDTSTDLRQQAIRSRIPRIDAVLYTHPHADHLHGIDELRSFNYIQKSKIPVFGNNWTCDELTKRFGYIFRGGPIVGGGTPLLELNLFDASSECIEVAGVQVIPIPVAHGSKECVGYRFGSIAYVTDCSSIPEKSLARLENLEYLLLDCLRIDPHDTHFNIDQSLATVATLKPKNTFLTHLGHDFEYSKWQKKLPKNVYFAYDGLTIDAQ